MAAEWSDEELVGYIESHSHTELALVANAHVKRLLDLAGLEMPSHLEQRAFIGCHYHDIKEILADARATIRARTQGPPLFPCSSSREASSNTTARSTCSS